MQIFNILAALLPTSSVSSLVSVITNFAAKLEAAEARQLGLAADLDQQAVVLIEKAISARAEATEAGIIAKNIRTLTVSRP